MLGLILWAGVIIVGFAFAIILYKHVVATLAQAVGA